MKLLIADDEQIIRNGLLSLPWKDIGVEEVYQAENGLTAKEILTEEKIDVVISDIKMPGLSGLELAEYIKECSMDTAVIFLTGYSDFEYARRAIRNQVSDYLLKPIRRKDILETVERVLQALERKRYKAEVVRKYETASGSLDLGGTNALAVPEGQPSDYGDSSGYGGKLRQRNFSEFFGGKISFFCSISFQDDKKGNRILF